MGGVGQPAPKPADSQAERQTPEVAGGDLRWPTDGIAITVTTGAQHATALQSLVLEMTRRFGTGLIITASRPAPVLRNAFTRAGVREHDLRFLDCVSMAGGLPLPDDGRIMHIPSPGLLELIVLRTEQWLQRLHARRFLVLDSLSTLALHNGIAPVAEAVHELRLRLTRLGVPAAFMVVDRQAPGLIEALDIPADALIRL